MNNNNNNNLPNEELIRREFYEIGIKLDLESDVTILEKCFGICTTMNISATDLAMKYDAFKFTRKLNSKLDLDLLREFELYLQDLRSTEKNNNNSNKRKNNVIKSAISVNNNLAKTLITNNTNKINYMNSAALSSMISNSSEQIFDSLFNTNPIKREHLTQSQTPAKRKQQNINNETNITSINTDIDITIDSTPVSNRVGVNNSNSSNNNNNISNNSNSDELVSSGSSTGNYISRANRGQILLSFNDSLAAASRPVIEENISIKPRIIEIELINHQSPNNFRFMFQNDEEIRELLAQRMEQLVETMQEKSQYKDIIKQMKKDRGDGIIKRELPLLTSNNNFSNTNTTTSSSTEHPNEIKVKTEEENDSDALDEDNSISLVGCTVRSQSAVITSGRVCINEEIDSRLTTNSISLEGDINLSNGSRIKLTLGLIEQYSLFPGQIIIAKGTNLNGTSLVIDDKSIITDASKPHLATNYHKIIEYNDSLQLKPLSIITAAGPFTTADNLNYAPLFDLLSVVVDLQPDILILMGPFLDIDHPAVSTLNDTAQEFFLNILTDIIRKLSPIRTKLIIIPSLKDVNSIYCYPQPAFDLGVNEFINELQSGKLILASNPATIRINDLCIGLNNIDLLSNFQELASIDSNDSSKLPRLARLTMHCIEQQSYYPLFPAPIIDLSHQSTIPIDYSLLNNYSMLLTPDILITPSKLKPFATALNSDCISINPEYLIRNKRDPGYYTSIAIHPLDEIELEVKNPINNNSKSKKVYSNSITKRTRVDLVKI